MKFKMDRDVLSHRMDVLVGMVPSRSSLPILTNVLIEADAERGVHLTATDLDVSLALVAPAEVSEGGAVAVAAKLFAETMRAVGAGEVEVAVSETQVEVSSPGRSFRLVGMDPGEFPRMPAEEGAAYFELAPEVLPQLIGRTAYAVSRDETRPALNGVLWELGAKELRMVATDGHRLARYRVAGDYPVEKEQQVIIPPKSLTQLQRLVKDAENPGPLRVELGENHVRWRLAEGVIFSKLIEGPFPRYEQVIPKDSDKRLLVGRERFMEEIRAVATVSDSLTRMVRMSLRAGEVCLTTRAQDVGEAKVACPDAAYEGEPLEIGYNASYVLDALQHMASERVEILLKSQVGPAVLREVEAPGPGDYLCLVMPLRLAE